MYKLHKSAVVHRWHIDYLPWAKQSLLCSLLFAYISRAAAPPVSAGVVIAAVTVTPQITVVTSELRHDEFTRVQ